MKYLPTEGEDDGASDHSLVETLMSSLDEEKRVRSATFTKIIGLCYHMNTHDESCCT